jgi:hypothetical protein
MGDDRLHSLLLAWEAHRRQGSEVSAAELCRDCPELLEEPTQRIRALCQMDALVHSEETLPGPIPATASAILASISTEPYSPTVLLRFSRGIRGFLVAPCR